LELAIDELKKSNDCQEVRLLGGNTIPWFPRKLSDIDYFSTQILEAGAELESDHVCIDAFQFLKHFISLDLKIMITVKEEK